MASSEKKRPNHVFNNCGDMFAAIYAVVTRKGKPELPRTDPRTFSERITQWSLARNHPDFAKTKPKPVKELPDINSERFGVMSPKLVAAANDLVFGNPSYQTKGNTTFGSYLYDKPYPLEHYMVDQSAKDEVRKELAAARQREFDTWFNQTNEEAKRLLTDLYNELLNQQKQV